MARILNDPENVNKSAEEVAELIMDVFQDHARQLRAAEARLVADRLVAEVEGGRVDGIPSRILEYIDEKRTQTHRLAVVGQIQGPQGTTHTVVLGPFRSPLPLTSEERFRAVLERPCTDAREAGERLAWDIKTGRGRGRFMLAPAFVKPSDAWDFYRGVGPAEDVAEVIEAIPREVGPVCVCGLKHKPRCLRHEPRP